jgi:general secretion pathway protein F
MLVTAIALGVIVVLLTYVVPQVVAVYQQSRQTLPWLTRALIATSDFFRATGWFWIAAFAAAIVAFVVADRRPAFRARWHAWALRLPGVGRLLRSLDTARFASTLAILVGSGAPILRSLEAAGDVVRMMPLARAAHAASALVREGVRCPARSRSRRCFLRCSFISSRTASRAGRWRRCSSAQQGNSSARPNAAWYGSPPDSARADRLMGAIVLVLVLAVMLPIVSMNQLVR